MSGDRRLSEMPRRDPSGGSGGPSHGSSGASARSLGLPYLPPTNPAMARQLQERLLVPPGLKERLRQDPLRLPRAPGAIAPGKKSTRPFQLSPLEWPGQIRSGKRGHGCASYEDILKASSKKTKTKTKHTSSVAVSGRGSEQRPAGSRLSSVGAGAASESSGTSASTELSAGSVQLDEVPQDVACIIDKVRKDARVGFFYLVASVPTYAVERHYYCLKVAPYSAIDPEEYFTISKHGVTHVLNKEADFVPLPEWERDYIMFQKLARIRTFRQFRMWKQFAQWRVNVRWCKFHLAQRSLSQNLFILQPCLRAALLAVRHLCNAVATLGIVDIDDTNIYTLDNFIQAESDQLGSVQDSLAEFRRLVRDIVQTACNTAMLEAGFPTEEYIEELALAVKCGQTVWKTKLHMDPQQCLALFKVGDYSQQMSFTEQADKRRQCQRLTRFIYTIDLILMTCKHQLVKNTLCYMERALSSRVERIPPEDQLIIELTAKPADKPKTEAKKPAGPSNEPPPPPEPSPEPPEPPEPGEEPETPAEPLFLTSLEFRGAVPRLVPPIKEFRLTVEKLLTSSRELVENMENLFTDDTFMFITRPTINGKTLGSDDQEGPDLEDVLDSDEQMADVSTHISEMVVVGFQAAETYIQTFEHVKEWFYENMRTDMTSFANIGCDLDQFGSALAKFTSQVNEVKNIPVDRKLGVFCVNASDVRDMVRPSPEHCLEQIHKIMPTVTKARVEALMQESQDAHYKLEITPTTTEEYVTFLTFLDDISIRIESLEQEADVVCQMVELMEDYQTPIPPEYIAEFNTLSPTVAILHDLTDNCVSDRDACVEKLSASLAKDIKTLSKDVESVTQQINEPVLLQMEADHKVVRDKLTACTDILRKHENAAATLKDHQKKFRLEVTKLEQLEKAQDELRLRTLLWDSLDEWDKFLNDTLVAPFNDLDVEELTQLVARFNKTVVQLEKGLPPNNVNAVLKAKVDDFRVKLTTIADLRNTTLRRRHWEAIERLLGRPLLDLDEQTPLTLRLLIDYQAFAKAEQIKEISGQASSEASLETLLGKVEAVWKSTEFSVVPLSGQKDVFILGGTDDIQQLLDESNINIQTISSSRHVGPIRSRVEDWEKRLGLFAKTLDEWLTCQRTWLYLGSVFCAPDIQRQLPTEAKLFIIVDKSYKDIMRRVYKVPLAIRAATQAGMLDALQTNNGLLDQIMKCLEAYLESKRVIFPRFYFLSNDELLEILAQTRNPQAVEPHLKKCFDAIHKLEFGTKENAEGQIEMSNEILAMLSPEKEHVPLTKGLKARGNVEDWLGKVEEAMFTSLRRAMKQALLDYAEPSKEAWVTSHPSQVVLTVSQIVWCRDVHAVLDGDHDRLAAMKAFEDEMFQTLNQLAAMVRGELKDLERNVLCALITISVHSRDIITGLVQSQCDSSGSFEWLKQLRYYWSVQADTCEAAMSLARHTYGYEYLGASPRLVITPLTDRCYLCLMGALQLDLGGAPAGPAGTGKTETTKDLAKSLAIQCVVFNCSEGIDYKMMGRFFSGLAQSGAWCCFDEFNRIDIEVLSVIAQQLITIRGAKVVGAQRFMFEGREIKLVRSCAAFITMNPGYAGRTELPDNLKALFRPISMMVPDYGLIAEVILYSEGFESSKNLARKMVHLFRLCSEQLSQQSHYDFGMRALKSVLVMAGRLKRENPQINEDIVLIRALRDANVPKFLSDDLVLFKAILDDLFPGAVIPEIDYGQLKECIIDVMVSMKMQPEPCQIRKVIQFHETMIVRHGVMLVGPSGGGKTTIYRILQKSLTKMLEDGHESPYYRVVHVEVLNPKSITMGELYGEVNLLTLEWRDGVLGRLVRGAVSDTTEDQHWIVFDGPVDAVWIENMNTVLDDNKLLCLTNSERIKLTPGVRMVFEVDDLAQASPATVSRCGMVFVDPGEMKWLPFVKTWLDDLEETGQLRDYMRAQLQQMFERYVEDGLRFVARSCTQAMPQAEVNKVAMMCRLMTSLLFGPGGLNPVKEPLRLNELLAQTFVFCYLWTVGGNLVEQHREQFEQFIRKQLEDNAEVKLPTHSDLWSFRMDYTNKKMDPWERIVPPFHFDPEMSFVNIVVPTVDTIRYSYLLDKLLAVNTSVMFTGGTGVGKSIIGRFQLLALGAKIVPVFFNFSANTTSMRAQEVVESKLERRRRTVLAAPAEKKVVVFIDDVNMPRPEIYGAQPPVELLRQLLDFGGLYDRKELFWKSIQDVVVCAACAPPGGGRHQLNGRFLRHFCMLLIPQPNEATLVHIFRSIVHGFLAGFAAPVKSLADAIVNSAVEIYIRISLDLLPTPSKSHYIFNLRDLSKCINGVLQADPSVIVDKEPMFRLFTHEAQRVFHDRLVTDDDKMYFNTMMLEVAGRNFAINMDPQVLRDTPILFGDFIKMGAEEDQKMYEEFKDHDKLQKVLQDYLDDYNVSGGREMQLVFFRDAVEHVTRLARILRTDRGNALLVGVGGTGKQSLTRLACHVNNATCFMIALCRGYDHTSFRDDLRQLYWQAGVQRNKTVFFFADYQIAQEEFMEDIDSILNSGEVPSLYDPEEYEKVIIASRPFAKQAGIPEGDRDAIFSHFISHVRSNLHIVLSMSPAGEAFRFYCRMFPAVVNCCTIDWFSEWPAEALLEVARKLLKKDEIGDPDLTENICKMCVTAHQDVVEARARFLNQLKRYYYVTPTSYLELINLYGTMLKEQKTKINGAKERISNGLKKLKETNSLVDTMSVELVALEPELKKKSADTELLMERLAKDQSAADKVREVVQVEEAAAKVKADETQTLADDAQKDLDEALPALEAAVKALDSLDKSDISEIKVFNKPPEMVQIVLEAVCILLGAKTDWATAKQVLSDNNFLKRLMEYDKENIPETVLRKIKKYIDDPKFVPEVVEKVSKACKSMCLWVRAIDLFARVFKEVEPKRAR
ncbi:Dynein heavy chain 6, axonemal [Amphibalanus amphitrite]|uniref:Dynein heavy chain 6, axonemal n=1 Tax=Amphibalanus amphitrite TaxID=1232801 RepID=A0A6A4WGE3_AMPAM|nr:Dynein heavy chain 6, axonemal [Amphibalanus amphitrite]